MQPLKSTKKETSLTMQVYCHLKCLGGCPKVPAGSSTSIVLVVLLSQFILMRPGLSGWFTQGKRQSLRSLSRSLEAEQSSGEHQGLLRGAEESKDGWVPFQKEGRVPDSCHGELLTLRLNSVACRDLRFSLGKSRQI